MSVIMLFKLHHIHGRKIFSVPILQLRKLRLRRVRKFGQDHTVKRGNVVSELSRV